jgi:hypothetical protein
VTGPTSSVDFTAADTWGGRPVARTISAAVPRGRVVVRGVIRSTGLTDRHGMPSYECAIDDGTGGLVLLFLGRSGVAGLTTGADCTVEGTARMEGGRMVLWNPLYRIDPRRD